LKEGKTYDADDKTSKHRRDMCANWERHLAAGGNAMNIQNQKDLAYYWSCCILRRLQAMGLLTAGEAEKARAASQKRYDSMLVVS
jgi:hypothetical protein